MLYQTFQASVLSSRFPRELTFQSYGKKKMMIFSSELHCNGVILGKQPPLCLSFSVCHGDGAVK